MIERQTIDGRPVTVGYLDQGFSPTDKDTAEIVKLSYDDGETNFLSTRPTGVDEGDAEADAWNAHRDRHRAPLVPPVPASRPTPPAPRDRTFTPVVKTIRNFALAMQEAEKHRSILKARYGFDDKQIGTLATAALAKHGQRPYHDLARSAIRAKRRLDTH
jgi:hypothetical protein